MRHSTAIVLRYHCNFHSRCGRNNVDKTPCGRNSLYSDKLTLFFFSVINLLKFNSEFKHISLHVPFCHQHFYRNMMVIMTHVWKIYVFFSFSFFLYIILTYVLTLYLIFTRCLHYINLHYLQYIYYNTITLVKLNYSWSIYVIVCMLIVRVTHKNFVC